jgi:hypothetical protein
MTDKPMSEEFIQSIHDLARQSRPRNRSLRGQWGKATKIVRTNERALEMAKKPMGDMSKLQLAAYLGCKIRLGKMLTEYHALYGEVNA